MRIIIVVFYLFKKKTGITSKLDYFVNSSVGAIWLSPINRSPMVDFGYDISDFKDIDKTFGSMADFENLLARAKELGIKVWSQRVFASSSTISQDDVLIAYIDREKIVRSKQQFSSFSLLGYSRSCAESHIRRALLVQSERERPGQIRGLLHMERRKRRNQYNTAEQLVECVWGIGLGLQQDP